MNAVPAPGLLDPVHDAQQAFRVALDAMARPGRVLPLGEPVAGLALGAAMAQLLLTLTDEDTPVWWQRRDQALEYWLRFHTGAPTVEDPARAAFAVVTHAASAPALERFSWGTAEAPEQSCTLLVETEGLDGGEALHAHGPGIASSMRLGIPGLPAGFWPQWQANHAAFPQGVDVFITCGARVIGLPRSTRLGRLEEA